jgi:hypothetical protein
MKELIGIVYNMIGRKSFLELTFLKIIVFLTSEFRLSNHVKTHKNY